MAECGKKGQVSPKLLDLLNITLPCGKNCPVEMAEVGDCSFDEQRNVVNLGFKLKNLKENATVLEADPFTITTRDNEGHICKAVYSGPKRVILDDNFKCVTPIPDTSNPNRDIILVPNYGSCPETILLNSTKTYFKKGQCLARGSGEIKGLVQVKTTAGPYLSVL